MSLNAFNGINEIFEVQHNSNKKIIINIYIPRDVFLLYALNNGIVDIIL